MKFRGLIVAVVLLAALGVTLYFVERKGGKTETAASKAEDKLFAVQADDIQEIRLEPAGGEALKLERGADNKWKIVEPKALAADDSAASSLASTLSGLYPSETIEEKPASLKDYGLEPPQQTVRFRAKSGSAYTLLLGDNTPSGGSVYTRTPDKPRVVTLASYVKSDLAKTLSDLRDKAVLKFDTNTASRAWVQSKSGKLELAKAEDRWQLAAPVQARADQFAVNDLLRQAAEARMQALESENAAAPDSKFGLGSPEIVFRVQDAKGSHELRISKEKNGKRYARSSDQPLIFTVSSDLATQLTKPLPDLRNKDVFDMDTWTASHIEATTPEARVVLDKDGGQWKGADPKKAPEQSAVSDLLEKLKAIRATSFPPAGPAAKYGLDKPVLRAHLVWGEKKQKETVEIGQVGDKAYARRQAEPAVYEVSNETLKAAREALNKLK